MIYVASSWRNPLHQAVVAFLRAEGFGVFDFRHPAPGNDGFHWSEIDPAWKRWGPDDFRKHLRDPIAVGGFTTDFDAMQASDIFVLVLPAGRSAHLELGWAEGAGKRTIVLLDNGSEPELMYNLVDSLVIGFSELLQHVKLHHAQLQAGEG